MSETLPAGYRFDGTRAEQTEAYLWGTVFAELARVPWAPGPRRVFDLGCGNGALAAALAAAGYVPSGADPSAEGIRIATAAHPTLNLRPGSAYDDLVASFGTFPALVSLEVVEHVFYPRKYARCVANLLAPGGTAVISTPYHGYWKNLALSLAGAWDKHHAPLWDYGHIKFWSVKTLTALFAEVGLAVERVHRVGRIPPLAKSLIVVVRKSGGEQ